MLGGHPLGELTGEELAGLRRQRIGYLSQEAAPIGFLSAQENVVLSLRIRGWDTDSAARRAAEALTRTGLRPPARQRSTGSQLGKPSAWRWPGRSPPRGLLIVDEPTSSQDESNARIIAALLVAAAHEEGQTVICASHDPAVIGQADNVVTLDA